MSHVSNSSIDELFDAAADLSSEEQEAFLDRVGAHDSELRERLAVLLAADRQPLDPRLQIAGIACSDAGHAQRDAPAALAVDVRADDPTSLSECTQGTGPDYRRSRRGVGRPDTRLASRAVTATDGGASTADRAATDDALGPGTRIGQYELIRELGRGGMAVVYLARDVKLARRVAIKFVLTPSSSHTRLFIIEARATARCRHENIVVIHDVGEHRQRPFMVLEYLKGQTMRHLLRSGRLAPRRAIELMVPVVRALVCAHERDIVHRDLKPENVLVTDVGEVKVLDFGIAKLMQQAAYGEDGGGDGPVTLDTAGQQHGAGGGPDATRPGAIVGTPPYMSPEQLAGGEIDHRTDIWAVGIMLAEMTLGHHLLPPSSFAALPGATDVDGRVPSMAEIAPDLDAIGPIIDRCLSPRKADRTATARALLAELEALLPGGGRPAIAEDRSPDDRSPAGRSPADQSPFAGLAAFQEADADRFFGRDSDIAGIVTRLRSHPLLTIAGPTGVGKSSLVRAGVIPALKRSGESWEAFIVRPGRHPVATLARLLVPLTAERQGGARDLERQLMTEPGRLGAALRARAGSTSRRIVVFVDQFEELYTLGADAGERAAFTACLEGAADDASSPLRVVLAVRSDFLDRVAEDRDLMSRVSRCLEFLPPIGRDGLGEALRRPVEAVGYRFEPPKLVDDMLDELEAARGALPLLQFTAARLWETRDRERCLLTGASYRAIGGVAGTLASHADTVLAGMSAPARALARAIFDRLVTPERTRDIASVSELRQLPGGADEVERVVYHLVDARLLTIEAGRDWDERGVEIVHESLIDRWPTLGRWLDENQGDAVFLARVRATAKQWEGSGRAEGMLWRGESAREAWRWHQRLRGALGARERAYVDAVFRLMERTTRIKRRVIGGIIALLVVLLVAAALALVSIRDAERQSSRQADTVEQTNRELADKNRALDVALFQAQREKQAALQAKREAQELQRTAVETARELNAALEAARRARDEARDSEVRAQRARAGAARNAHDARIARDEARAAELKARAEKAKADEAAAAERQSREALEQLIERAVGYLPEELE